MANKNFEFADDPADLIGVTCATDITDTTLAYRLSDTDNEVAVKVGDGEQITGWPDKKAKAGEPFNLRPGKRGVIATAAEAFAANGFRIVGAANGKVRKAILRAPYWEGRERNI